MLRKELIPQLWTWVAWEKAKYGSMDRAQADIGLLQLMAIAVNAAMSVHFVRPNAILVAANQLSNGTSSLKSNIHECKIEILVNFLPKYIMFSGTMFPDPG